MITAEEAYEKATKNAKDKKENRIKYIIRVCESQIIQSIDEGLFFSYVFSDVREDFPYIEKYLSSSPLNYKVEIKAKKEHSLFPHIKSQYLKISWDKQ